LAPKSRHAFRNFFECIGAADGFDDFLFFALAPVSTSIVGAGADFALGVAVRGISVGISGMVLVVLADQVGCIRDILRFGFARRALEGFNVGGVACGIMLGADRRRSIGGDIRDGTIGLFIGDRGPLIATLCPYRFARDPLGGASGAAMAWSAAATGAALDLVLGVAMRTLFLRNQRLPVGNRDLIIVGMDFAEGQEAMAVTAIVDERGLQRGLYARNFGKVDIAAKLAAACGLEVEFLHAVAAQDDHPGLLRMGRIDEHLVGH
jgi:hypothetical protein